MLASFVWRSLMKNLEEIKGIKKNRGRENYVLSFAFIDDGRIKMPIVLNVLVSAPFLLGIGTNISQTPYKHI